MLGFPAAACTDQRLEGACVSVNRRGDEQAWHSVGGVSCSLKRKAVLMYAAAWMASEGRSSHRTNCTIPHVWGGWRSESAAQEAEWWAPGAQRKGGGGALWGWSSGFAGGGVLDSGGDAAPGIRGFGPGRGTEVLPRRLTLFTSPQEAKGDGGVVQ